MSAALCAIGASCRPAFFVLLTAALLLVAHHLPRCSLPPSPPVCVPIRVAEGSGLVPGNAKLANEAEGNESEDFFDAVDCCN